MNSDLIDDAFLSNDFATLFDDLPSSSDTISSIPDDFFSWIEGIEGEMNLQSIDFSTSDLSSIQGQSSPGGISPQPSLDAIWNPQDTIIATSDYTETCLPPPIPLACDSPSCGIFEYQADSPNTALSEETSNLDMFRGYSRRVVPAEAFGRRFLAYEASPLPLPTPKLLAEYSNDSIAQDVRLSQFMLTGFRYLKPEPRDKIGYIAPEPSPIIQKYLSQPYSPRRRGGRTKDLLHDSKKAQPGRVQGHRRKASHKKGAASTFRDTLQDAARRASQRDKAASAKPLAAKLKSCLKSVMSSGTSKPKKSVSFLDPTQSTMFAR